MKTLLSILTTVLSVGTLKACSCFAPITYCETIETYPANLTIVGVKIADFHHGMQVGVMHIIDGTELRDTLTVWGDNGALCRWYTSNFNVGDTLIYALHNCDLAGNWFSTDSLEEANHYHISVCGVYHLGYSNGMVSGSVAAGIHNVSLNDFSNTNQLCDITAIEKATALVWYQHYEPTTRCLTLRNLPLAETSFTLFSQTGKRVLQSYFFEKTVRIDLSGIPKGVYFVQLETGEKNGIRKLLRY